MTTVSASAARTARGSFLAQIALPLAAGLGAAKPPLPDEQTQDAVNEAATDPDQPVLPAKWTRIGISHVVGIRKP